MYSSESQPPVDLEELASLFQQEFINKEFSKNQKVNSSGVVSQKTINLGVCVSV